MPGMIRTNEKAMKIAYKILKVHKNKQQKNEPKASDKKQREWFRDSSTAQ
jgi:hypothetical protein